MSALGRWLHKREIIVMSVIGLTVGISFQMLVPVGVLDADIAGVEWFQWVVIAFLGMIIGAVVGKYSKSSASAAFLSRVISGPVAGCLLGVILTMVILENYPSCIGCMQGMLIIAGPIVGLIAGVILGLIVGIIGAVIGNAANRHSQRPLREG